MLKKGNRMDDKERLAFLKQMGLSVGRLHTEKEEKKTTKQRKDTRVEKSDLIALARKFDVTPTPKKAQTFEEFAKEEEGEKDDR